MPEMDITGTLLLITVIGALIGAIVLYHLWVDPRAPAAARLLRRVAPAGRLRAGPSGGTRPAGSRCRGTRRIR
jgi:hypothetical protein